MLIVFMILALFYLEINSVAAGKKSKSVEKFGPGGGYTLDSRS